MIDKLKRQFKALDKVDIIRIILELFAFITFIVMAIYFSVAKAKGQTILGASKSGFEIAVIIILYLLFAMMGFVLYYDVFVKDYEKENKARPEKIVRNGKVITINSSQIDEEKKEDNK